MTSVDARYFRIKTALALASSGFPVVQRQDSQADQLYDLWIVATKLGMYDAADWLWKNANVESNV